MLSQVDRRTGRKPPDTPKKKKRRGRSTAPPRAHAEAKPSEKRKQETSEEVPEVSYEGFGNGIEGLWKIASDATKAVARLLTPRPLGRSWPVLSLSWWHIRHDVCVCVWSRRRRRGRGSDPVRQVNRHAIGSSRPCSSAGPESRKKQSKSGTRDGGWLRCARCESTALSPN